MSHPTSPDPAAAPQGIADRGAYDGHFAARVHRVGRITLIVALLATLSIPMYLIVVLGHGVDTTLLAAGVVFAVSFVGIVWVVEPISYYPVLGPIGTYMSFLSGNAANMRVPVVGAVQDAVDAEPGTKKAEIAAVFGLMASTVTNLAVLLFVILAGTWLVSVLPDPVTAAFVHAIPAIVGCMIVTFGMKLSPSKALVTIALAAAVVLAVKGVGQVAPELGRVLSIAQVGIAAVLAIALAVALGRRTAAPADEGRTA